MSEFDDFVEVNNELPYKPINAIKILSVKTENNKFMITCKCQIQGELNDTETLVRTWEDINWLIDNISSNKKTYLAPKINTQNYLQLLYQKMSYQPASSAEYQRRLNQKMAERALLLITTIILEHLKTLGDQYVYPIFIFFHKNFGLYKNPIYYKEDSTPITQKVGSYFWETYAKLSGKQAGWEDIQKCKTTISNEMEQFKLARAKIADYAYLLAKLQEQFYGEKEKIKNQHALVEKLLLSYENQVKYLELIVQEITDTLVKVENRNIVEQLMKQYSLFLNEQAEKSAKAGKQLIKQYVAVMCKHEERIKINAH